MQTKTIIYKGPLAHYSMKEYGATTFLRGLPMTVNAALLNHLPSDDFEEFNPKIHKPPKDIKPILIRLPKGLANILSVNRSLQKLREYYPYNPIEVLAVSKLHFVIPKIKNLKIIESYNVHPGQFFKEYSSHIGDGNPSFGAAALYKHSREFCYLQHFKLMYGVSPKSLTLLPNKSVRKYITIVNHGQTIGTSWTELGDYFAKQKWPDELQVLTKSDNIKKVYETIKQSKYVIFTGDTETAFLAAYLGVPLCAFIPDTKSIFIHQLDFFNQLNKNHVLYSPFVFNKDLKAIYKKLFKIIPAVLNGEELPKAPSQRKPLNIKKEPGRDGRTG